MTLEVRAAIEGAREAGARSVLVNDSHWSMRNLLFDELPDDDDLRVISGAPKPWSMMQGLDADVRRRIFHRLPCARRATAATLAHTFSESVYRVTVNGTRAARRCLTRRSRAATAFRSC